MERKSVAIGFVGTTLDMGKAENRWQRWRPTVALCMHEDFLVDRLELIHDGRTQKLAEHLRADIARVSPETDVRFNRIDLKDPWDFEEVYGALHDFAAGYAFDPESEDYFVNITTGTHVAQICWFLLIEARYIPAKILQLTPPKASGAAIAGQIQRHRHRSVALRPHRHAVQGRAGRGHLVPEVRHRHAQSRVQPHDRPHRAGRRPLEGAAAAHRADGCGQIAACAAHLRSEEDAPPGGRPVRRGQLRHLARRQRHVRTLRPPQGRVHRRHAGPARPPAHCSWRRAVPGRDRRAWA